MKEEQLVSIYPGYRETRLDAECPKCGHRYKIKVRQMEEVENRETAKGKIRLTPGETIEMEAVFDTGTPISVMATDLAERLEKAGEIYSKFGADQQYDIYLGDGEMIRITGWASSPVELSGYEIPSTVFEVSPDLPEGTLIIGKSEIWWKWDVVMDGGNPRLEKPVAFNLF